MPSVEVCPSVHYSEYSLVNRTQTQLISAHLELFEGSVGVVVGAFEGLKEAFGELHGVMS